MRAELTELQRASSERAANFARREKLAKVHQLIMHKKKSFLDIRNIETVEPDVEEDDVVEEMETRPESEPKVLNKTQKQKTAKNAQKP